MSMNALHARDSALTTRSKSKNSKLLPAPLDNSSARHHEIRSRTRVSSTSLLIVDTSDHTELPPPAAAHNSSRSSHRHATAMADSPIVGLTPPTSSKALEPPCEEGSPRSSRSTQRIICYTSTSEDRTNTIESTYSLDSKATRLSSEAALGSSDDDQKSRPQARQAVENENAEGRMIITRELAMHVMYSMLLVLLVMGGAVAMKEWRARNATTTEQVEDLKDYVKAAIARMEERVGEAEKKASDLASESLRQAAEQAAKVAEDAAKMAALVLKPETERPDYALSSGGGRVVGHSLAFQPGGSAKLGWWNRMGKGASALHPLAAAILQPSFGQPGHCLPLAGSNVHVDVALRTPIFPDQIALSHVAKTIAYDISSAPKDFHTYGLSSPLSNNKDTNSSWTLLGEFTYDINKTEVVQTFNLSELAKKTSVGTIRLHVLSNYGSSSHTCIYRLQVHGQETD